jgi:hypothetical protein
MKFFFYFVVIISFFAFAACSKSGSSGDTGGGTTTVDCAGSTAKFSTDASPVFVTKCAISSGCHSTGATNSGGVLITHTQISAKKANIRTAVLNGTMPQGSTLTTAQKQAIVCWIDNGALNN